MHIYKITFTKTSAGWQLADQNGLLQDQITVNLMMLGFQVFINTKLMYKEMILEMPLQVIYLLFRNPVLSLIDERTRFLESFCMH